MVINGSNDISLLSIKVTWDISGTTPQILLENLSQGSDLASCSYWFIVKSPTTTIIHEGSESDPDETGIWSTDILTDPWPRPFNQIEWSGAPYTFQSYVKDGDGNIYAGEIQNATICRPNGNLPTSKNTYGLGAVEVKSICDQARIYFQDVTNTSYKGLTGEIGSSVLMVNYPIDDTGYRPDPFVGNYFSTAMVPITYSGNGYQFLYTSVYDYELEENTIVRIKYLLNKTFGVWCNIDLMPLVCEFEKLGASISDGTCTDMQSAQNKMNLIAPKMFRVFIGMSQPLTGVDVPALIEEIKLIGDFDCDCCNAATGIVPTGSSAFDGYTFQIVSEGGDIGGTVGGSGYNIQFLLHDVKYIVKICDSSPSETTAFAFTPSLSGDGYTETYCLTIDITQLGYDLATDIAANPDLLNFWQQLFLNNGGTWTLMVDGGCIFDTSDACDYSFTLSNIPVSSTFALITGIKVGSATIPLSFSLNLTNIGAFQTYLNSLGYGTFVVTNPSGQTVLVESTANTNTLDNLTYKISVSNYIASLTKDCTGFVPISANEVVQNIINYLCSLDDSQIVTSDEYEICYIDPTTQIKTISTVASATLLSEFITELLARGCDTIDYIVSLGSLDCASIKNKFPYMAQAMQPNDIFLVTKNGACSQATPNEIFLTLLTYGAANADVKDAFCAFVQSCTGLPCTPYDDFYVTVEAGSPTSVQDLVVTFSNPDAISNDIRYARIDNTTTPVYTTLSGILPGASPYTISGVPTGQYRVYIKPNYADGRRCQEIFYTTPDCTGLNALSAVYDGSTINVTYSLSIDVPQIKIIVNYPNGGQATYIYNNGDTIEITPPTDVFGVFQVTAQGVCNEDSGFFSNAAAPVSVTVNPTNNSSIQNATSASNFTVQVDADSNTVVGVSSLSVAQTIDFYLNDGTYSTILVKGVGTGYSVYLTTGTGTYYAVYGGGSKWAFSGIPVLDGAIITIIDDTSPPSYTFTVTNNATAPITGVSGTTDFYLISSGEFPLTTGESLYGVQGGYSGVISVEESGLIGDWHATLYINSVEIECVFSTGGTQSFSSQTIVAGDDVEIIITDGGC